MPNDNVILMGKHAEDSRLWSPEQCLDELLTDIRSGKHKPKKLIVLFWEDLHGDGRLTRGERYVNFTYTESVAFLTLAQQDAIESWRGRK
jgi:hypothetical protein